MSDDDKPLTPAERMLLEKLAKRAARDEKRKASKPEPKPYRHIGEKFDPSAFRVPTLSEADLKARQDAADSIRIRCNLHNAAPHEPCTFEKGVPRNCPARTKRWRAMEPNRQAELERQNRLELAAQLRRAGVPEKHLRMVESGVWKEYPSWRSANKFYASSWQGLVLAGDTGRGKSGAACYIASKGPRLRPGKVVWVRASTLGTIDLWQRSVSQAMRDQTEAEEAQARRHRLTWDELLEAQLIVLDDLGTGRLVDDVKFCDRLVDFLAAAIDNEREVVMTYNGDKSDFQKLIVPQVWDRVDRWFMWEETGGDSFRE